MTASDKKPAARKQAAQKYKYKLKFVPSALKEWEGLDGSVKENFRDILRKRLDNPHVPGSALRGSLKGYYKIKLRQQGYRLVYGVEDDALVVMVMAVDKREDSAVYQSALDRIVAKPTVAASVLKTAVKASGAAVEKVSAGKSKARKK